MFRRQLLAVSGLSLATALAGCSFSLDGRTPTPPVETQEITVNFTNDADRAIRFTAAVVPSGLGGVRIRYRDGSERTVDDAAALADVPADAWDGAVTFAPLADDAIVRRFDSTAGSGVGMTFEEVPRGADVVTAVADPAVEDSMLSVTTSTCGDVDVAQVRVDVGDTGSVDVSTTCADDAAD